MPASAYSAMQGGHTQHLLVTERLSVLASIAPCI